MKPEFEQIDRILKKVTRIIEERKQVDNLNKQIQQEKQDLALNLNEREEQLGQVQEQLRSLKVAHRMLETSKSVGLGEGILTGEDNISANIDNDELKIKIDHYIKEIDKCIATLNN